MLGDLIALGLFLSVLVAYGFCCYRLSERLGYDGMMGILLLIPLVNVVLMFYWAISESPNERKIKSLERKLVKAKERGPVEVSAEVEEEVDALAALGE